MNAINTVSTPNTTTALELLAIQLERQSDPQVEMALALRQDALNALVDEMLFPVSLAEEIAVVEAEMARREVTQGADWASLIDALVSNSIPF
jgi:hypothetical protein